MENTARMAKTSRVPWYVPLANKLIVALLRAGFKVVGPGHYRWELPYVPAHGTRTQKWAAAYGSAGDHPTQWQSLCGCRV